MIKRQYTMFDRANLTAKILLEIGAVKFSPDNPFILTSGRESPVYVDVRRLISFPEYRCWVTAMVCNQFYQEIGSTNIDVVAGGESAGIPFATLVANRLHKPMIYIRKQPKAHGTGSQIEGVLHEGQRVLLVEDLMSEGTAKQVFLRAIENAGGFCDEIFVIFHYGCFEHIVNARVHSLTKFSTVVDVAEDLGQYTSEVTTKIREFLASPTTWTKKTDDPPFTSWDEATPSSNDNATRAYHDPTSQQTECVD